MPIIWIPPALRSLTDGKCRVRTTGKTVAQALDDLEAIHPGIREQLYKGDALDPYIMVVVDGDVSGMRMLHTLHEDSEVHLLPIFAGG